MRKQPQLQGKLLAKGSGIINWWMNWCRSLAILMLPKRTAVSSIHRWTAFCAAVEYAIWFSPVSSTNVCVELDATRWLFLEYFGVVLEDATHRGPEFAQKAALFNIETFWLGQRRRTFCDALSPTSLLVIS